MNKSIDRKAREARRKQRQTKGIIESSESCNGTRMCPTELTRFLAKHAAATQHQNFSYTRKQNMRWLQDQYNLPDHGEIPEEAAFELDRYFNVRKEEELRGVRLSAEAAVFLFCFFFWRDWRRRGR